MKTPVALPRQEELLVDYANRLSNHCQERLAVHLRLSHLRPFNRKDHHLRMVVATLDPLVKRYEGQLFQLSNADLVFVGREVSRGTLEDVMIKIRYMFRDDPFVEQAEEQLTEPGSEAEAFYRVFNLEEEYGDFLGCALWLNDICAVEVEDDEPGYVSPEDPDLTSHPLDPEALGRLEQSLERLDLNNVLRKFYIYVLADGTVPQPVLCKHYASIPELQKQLLPEYNLCADRWLLQRLTAQLDQRVIAKLMDIEIGNAFPVNIEMHSSSVLLETFPPFVAAVKRRSGKSVLVDIPAVDLLGDMQTFTFARDFLRANGQKIAITDMDPMLFEILDRTALQADLYKVRWSAEYEDWLMGKGRSLFERAVQSIGPRHVALIGCDSARSVEFGVSAGIRLFQGRYIDFLSENKQPFVVES